MKKVYLVSGLGVAGVLTYLFFFKKNTNPAQPSNKSDNSPINSGGIAGITENNDSILDSASTKDSTDEEFKFNRDIINDLKDKVRITEKRRDKFLEQRNRYGNPDKLPTLKLYGIKQIHFEMYDRKVIQEEEEIYDIEQNILDYEQKILDLGYVMTARGTFYKR